MPQEIRLHSISCNSTFDHCLLNSIVRIVIKVPPCFYSKMSLSNNIYNTNTNSINSNDYKHIKVLSMYQAKFKHFTYTNSYVTATLEDR